MSGSTIKKPILTKMQSATHSNCRLGNKAVHKTGEGRKLQVQEADPELVAIVQACRRFPEGHPKAGKALPASCTCEQWKKTKECEHSQTKQWCLLRDAYAAKNYSLPWRAAQLQWKTNQHLAGERVRCRFCPGPPTCEHKLQSGRCPVCLTGCNRCGNSGYYMAQPDLESLAYSGLLEAIRNCDFTKGGMKISTYAVWIMKHSMLSLLRQTPIFFPQELLRDRRVIQDLKKKGAEPTLEQIYAALSAVRKCRQSETLEQRRLLAEGCYYGQDKSSVEQLQGKYIERSDRYEKRQRKGKAAFVVESLSVQPSAVKTDFVENEELQTVLEALPLEKLKIVRQFLRGKIAELPADILDTLREEML